MFMQSLYSSRLALRMTLSQECKKAVMHSQHVTRNLEYVNEIYRDIALHL